MKIGNILQQYRELDRPLQTLLFGVLFAHLAFYMVLPYIAIVLAKQRGVGLAAVGLLLAGQSMAGQFASLIGGWLTDRTSRRITLAVALILWGVGIFVLGMTANFGILWIGALVSGVGLGFYQPAAKSGIATRASAENQVTVFSLRGIAANVGCTLGPLLGVLLYGMSTRLLFTVSAVLFIALTAVHWFGLPPETGPRITNQATSHNGQQMQVFKDIPFLVLCGATVLMWALYAQFILAIPIRATEFHASTRAIGTLWTVSSILIILLQNSISRVASKRFHPMTTLALGTLLMAVGLGTVVFAHSLGILLVSVSIFTFGEMLMMPTVDSIVSMFATSDTIGVYFGLSACVWGLGEAIGNSIGGKCMAYAEATGRLTLPWISFFLYGMGVAAILYTLGRWVPLARRLGRGFTLPVRERSVRLRWPRSRGLRRG